MAEQDNSKLLEGIAYFEKMLKVMPGDRTTLEFLSVAYEQLGDAEKQRISLIQLGEALLREKDLEAFSRNRLCLRAVLSCRVLPLYLSAL